MITIAHCYNEIINHYDIISWEIFFMLCVKHMTSSSRQSILIILSLVKGLVDLLTSLWSRCYVSYKRQELALEKALLEGELIYVAQLW